ncbi:MAG: peptidase domain-containing ABC transporter [Flavobacteriales bacterium]|jgi:ABC-type bacteriocin/lantibiotic exporter with double-glycine peptidase domain
MADGTSNSSAVKRFFRLVHNERVDIQNIIIFAVFSGLINLSLPLGIQAIINFLNAGEISTSWAILLIFVIVGVALVGFLQIKQLAITETIEQRVFAKAAFDFAFRIPRIKQDAVQNKYVPELVNRFFEILTVQKGLSKILIDFSSAALQIIFGLILLSLYHPMFILLGLGLVLLLYVIFRITGPAGLRTSLEESKYKFEVAHWLEEIGRTMNTFKLIGNSELPIKRTDELVSGYLKARKKHFRILVWQFSGMIVFKVVVAAGLLILGSLLVIDRQINIGQFVAAEVIIVMLIGAVEKLILSMDTIYDLLTALEKIGTVTDLPVEEDKGTDLRETECDQGLNIRFNNVVFSYPDGDDKVLKGASLEIISGHRVCIKGPNGVGKTTLLKLLTGMYSNFQGTITLNGLPFRSLRIEALRAIIGDNLNDTDVFKGTLFENIHAGRPNISKDQVMWALKEVQLDEFVSSHPTGLETPIDPEGKRLSKTITRKIVLARAIAEKPKILLLEDNLTNLNHDERQLIYNNILSKKHGWTVIIVSNDDAVANKCDDRYIMENGVIIN